jgi:hypothetical protein
MDVPGTSVERNHRGEQSEDHSRSLRIPRASTISDLPGIELWETRKQNVSR